MSYIVKQALGFYYVDDGTELWSEAKTTTTSSSDTTTSTDNDNETSTLSSTTTDTTTTYYYIEQKLWVIRISPLPGS